MKSGGAFVPVDPKYPDDRVSYIIEDSKSKFVITTKEIANEKKELLDKADVEVFLIEDIAKSKKINNPNLKI